MRPIERFGIRFRMRPVAHKHWQQVQMILQRFTVDRSDHRHRRQKRELISTWLRSNRRGQKHSLAVLRSGADEQGVKMFTRSARRDAIVSTSHALDRSFSSVDSPIDEMAVFVDHRGLGPRSAEGRSRRENDLEIVVRFFVAQNRSVI